MTLVTSFQASLRRVSTETSKALPRHLCSSKHCILPFLSHHTAQRQSHTSSTQSTAGAGHHTILGSTLHTAAPQRDTAVAPCDQEAEDVQHMAVALELAKKAAWLGEVPVGAVLVSGGRILSRAHNLVERYSDPTAHAEMLVIRQAAMQKGGRWPLREATLYVTLEPCAMCAGAILLARVGTVVYGARSTLLGADGSWASLFPPQSAAEQQLATEATSPCCSQDGAANLADGASLRPHATHPDLQVRRGVLAGECAALMQGFFQQRRLENKARDTGNRAGAVSGLWTSLKRSIMSIFYWV